jgi:hypothetical protein
MTKEWSEEGLNFDAKVEVAELRKFGIQKTVSKKRKKKDKDGN